MSLSASSLEERIKSKIFQKTGVVPDSQHSLIALIAEAIVEEITINAVVTPTLLIAPPTGGPVTGTGKIS